MPWTAPDGGGRLSAAAGGLGEACGGRIAGAEQAALHQGDAEHDDEAAEDDVAVQQVVRGIGRRREAAGCSRT